MADNLSDDPILQALAVAKTPSTPQSEAPIAEGRILPYKKYADGRVEFDPTAGILGGIGRAVTSVGRAMKGEIPLHEINEEGEVVPSRQAIDEAMNVAGQVMLSSAPSGVAQTLREGFDPNVLRTSAGATSPTANLDALAEAVRLEGLGWNRDDIWHRTGWGRNVADQWFYEIPDDLMKLRPLQISPNTGKLIPRESTLGQDVDHKLYFDAYPQLANLKLEHGFMSGKQGAYHHPSGGIAGKIEIGPEDAREVLIHEMSHPVQQIESFPRGGSPQDPTLTNVATELSQRADAIIKSLQEERADFWKSFFERYPIDTKNPIEVSNAYKFGNRLWSQQNPERNAALEQAYKDVNIRGPKGSYSRLAGEIDANIAMQSRDMTPRQRREYAPWRRTAGKVPRSSQIIRFGDEEPYLPDFRLEDYIQRADGGRTGYAGKGAVREDDDVRSALDIARQYEDPANRIEADIRALTQNLSGLDISSAFPAFHTGLPQRPQVGGAGLVPSKPSNNPDLFDFSRLSEVPKVQQFDLPRYQPARGVPARVTEMMANPDVRNAVLQTISEGVQKGGAKWYNADPLRDKFIEKLGADAGDAAFRKYMDLVAATSPRSDVGTNVRNASYYYQRAMSGQPMPEVGEKNPQPYGHMAQKLHQMNAQRVAGEGWDPLQNPKPASFVENLVGNQAPVTVDTHAYRLPAILARDPRFLEISFKPEKDVPPMNIQKMVESGKIPFEEAVKRPAYWQSQPKENEYGAMEQYYKSLGKELGLTPAQTQAAAWVGGGKITGLQSDESKPFLQFFQDRIFKTAAETGMDPKDVLDKFIKGEATLRAEGGRTTENNAVGNAIRAARDHFDFGGDVRGGDSPFMSRSDYGLRSAPTPSFREAEDRSMREYNRAIESGWSPTGGGSDRSQSPLENTLTGRSQGFEGAPPVNMPSNIGELLGYNRARQNMLQQQQQQQSAEQEAENQRIKDALAMASVGQTSFAQSGILPSGFPPVEKQPVYWGGTPPDLPASTVERALQLTQMPSIGGLPAGTTLGRTEMPLQAEMAGSPQETYDQMFARSTFAPQVNAQFAMAGSPYAVTPSAPTTMFAEANRPAFPHTPTPKPEQVAQVATQPDVSASLNQPFRAVSTAPQQVTQNVPFPVARPDDLVAQAVAAASAPTFVATSGKVETPYIDEVDNQPPMAVLPARKTAEVMKGVAAPNVPMPMARPSDVRETNPIASVIDAIKADLARQEGERINALEAAGKTATFPNYSSASDPLAAQRAYLTDIGLDPNNPADMAKVRARIIQQDGQDKVDYYTKSLSEALFGAPSEEQKVAAALTAAREGGGGDRAPVQQAATQAPTVTPPPYTTELSEGNLALPHPEGLSAQQWADKYAGGDINKVHARVKFMNGAPTLEYYTV